MFGGSTRKLALGLGGVGLAVCGVLAGARRAARDVPLSPLHGDGYVGATWPARRGLRGGRVSGEMDSLADYARPGFDPDAVHPDVRALYERTDSFGMTVDAAWHRPYALGARAASRWTSRIEQLNLPGPGDDPKRVSSDLFALSDAAAAEDPRDDPRLWVRTDDETGEAVFVAVYASYVDGGERFVDIAVPLPGANLSTVLRIEHDGAAGGVALTTNCPNGGLYLHTRAGAVRLPAAQRFRVRPASDPDAPFSDSGDFEGLGDGADVLAEQRIALCGLPLVTVRYAAARASESGK
ncbi:hypothetical protein NDI76_14995 [Halogeometricum sp. S1BR25-6]|uniref:Uncharacterized protein n=1 Tax=Halogeometricum salsisoli TaxID=2950536 RepID=A0ABU2GI05_9EURY|nr:hypothetical protein [Halogeometricum sp. S1BR25-6]MDS0300051.1 hypothetical protein [Halogeometricum sp. S1BR25-6]